MTRHHPANMEMLGQKDAVHGARVFVGGGIESHMMKAKVSHMALRLLSDFTNSEWSLTDLIMLQQACSDFDSDVAESNLKCVIHGFPLAPSDVDTRKM